MPDQNDDEQNIDTLRSMLKASGASAVLKAAGKKDGDEGDSEPDGDEGEGEGDGEGKFNADYMKKHMKKYLKEKPEDVKAFMKKFMKDGSDEAKKFMKDLNLNKAAVLDAAETTAGVEDAEVTVVDGTLLFKAFTQFTESVSAVLDEMNERIHGLTAMQMESNLLQKASGHVLIKAAEAIDQAGAEPLPVRGQQASGAGQQGLLDAGQPLQKAASLGMVRIKDLLLKAAMGGDQTAAKIAGQVDIAGGSLGRLPATSIKFINDLAERASVGQGA